MKKNIACAIFILLLISLISCGKRSPSGPGGPVNTRTATSTFTRISTAVNTATITPTGTQAIYCADHSHLSGGSCACDNGWYDCDGDMGNGCENNGACPSNSDTPGLSATATAGMASAETATCTMTPYASTTFTATAEATLQDTATDTPQDTATETITRTRTVTETMSETELVTETTTPAYAGTPEDTFTPTVTQTATQIIPYPGGIVVISQVYGGGGGTQSTAMYKQDFVELHNRSNYPVDLTGWSLQYAAYNGISWATKVDLSGIIPAGGYFLLCLGNTGTFGMDILGADITDTAMNLSITRGKVALSSSTNVLTPDPSGCPIDASVVDFIGYGVGVNCGEGSAINTNLSDSTAAIRQMSGCSDTNSNIPDFIIAAPVIVRNTSSTPYYCY